MYMVNIIPRITVLNDEMRRGPEVSQAVDWQPGIDVDFRSIRYSVGLSAI